MKHIESKRKLTVVYHIRAKGVQKNSRKPLEFDILKASLHELCIDNEAITQTIFDKYLSDKIRENITKDDINSVLSSEQDEGALAPLELTDEEYHQLLNMCVPNNKVLDLEDFEEMYNGESVRFVGRIFEKAQKDPKKPAIKTVYLPKIINRAIRKNRTLEEETGRWLPLLTDPTTSTSELLR
jgi:hypothetical protein